MPLSFAVDIRQLFRDAPDIEAMKRYGLDLSSYEQVKEKAPEIYATFEDGSMRCDEHWPKDNVAAVQTLDGRRHGRLSLSLLAKAEDSPRSLLRIPIETYSA